MRRVWIEGCLGVALFLVGSWISGCATLSPGPRRENFGPLFLYSEDEAKEGRESDVLGPFFLHRKDTEETDLAFRPFFYWREKPGEYTFLEYLYPFGKYKRTDREVESYFIPFYLSRYDLTQKDQQKKESGFFPVFWGETETGESYGGLFPIYGNLKKRFGRDELNFFLWPIYSDSSLEGNKTTSLFWPFFSYTTGGGREGFKVWPLYGHEQKENSYEKTFFAWPIFHFEERYLYTDDPTKIDMVFPFYVSSANSNRVSRSILWPFFTYTHNSSEAYTQWDFPWPFIQWAEGENKSILRIFPLYGHKHWEDRDRGYILWPVYWYVHQEDDTYKKEINRFFVLSKDQTEVWKNEGEQSRKLRVWPFFYFRQEREGGVYFYYPSLIPVDYEGYERNWIPLLTLYEYRRNPAGESESKFLWGCYVHRQSVDRELYELSFFLTYYTAEDLFYFSLLKGLLEYRVDGSKHALRLFYWPRPIEWPSDLAHSEAESAMEGEVQTLLIKVD